VALGLIFDSKDETYAIAQPFEFLEPNDAVSPNHANPYVGASRPRSWSHLPVLGAISWAFIATY